MCRTGGRRCPGQDTPEGRAARNARRRAQYAARKGKGGVASGNPVEAPTTPNEQLQQAMNTINDVIADLKSNLGQETPTVSVESINPEPLPTQEKKPSTKKASTVKKTSAKLSKKKLSEDPTNVDKVPTVEEIDALINVPMSEDDKMRAGALPFTEKVALEEKYSTSETGDNNGAMPGSIMFAERPDGVKNPPKFEQAMILKGTIDYDKLDDDSYQYFGFTNGVSDTFTDNTTEYSRKELEKAQLEEAEKKAIRCFTGSDYEELNLAHYNRGRDFDNLPDTIESKWSNGKTQKEILETGSGSYLAGNRSKESIKVFTDTLDSALNKGPKIQRRVYRGAGHAEIEGFQNMSKEQVDAWVDENRSVGTVIEYAGYQSSSLDPKIAGNFARNSGIMYEIITPEGLAIESDSLFQMEREVLLPRNSKYAVVGVQKDVQSPSNENKKCTVIQLVAVNSKGEILDGTNSDPIEEFTYEPTGKIEVR